MFDKITITLSTEVRKKLADDPRFRSSRMLQHALHVPIDLVRCGLYGGVRGDPTFFNPVIGPTSAQGEEFAQSLRDCDRVVGYIYLGDKFHSGDRLFVEVSLIFPSRLKKKNLIFNFGMTEDGIAHQLRK